METDVRQLAENCIEWLRTCRSIAQDENSKAALHNRLADFHLWCDGVGARAGPRASLDRRFQSRPDDLFMIKGMLILLHQYLKNYAELLRDAHDIDEALRNVDSALENLALLAMAIRQTGKRSRLERADSKYDPNKHHLLRDHLEFIIHTLHRDLSQGHTNSNDPSPLDWRQRRLVDANLRRRNRFVQAQQHSQHLKSEQAAQTTVEPYQPESKNISHDTQPTFTSHPAIQAQRLTVAKSPNALENTVSGTSASAPDSKMKLDFRQFKRPSPVTEGPRTTITKINASTSYPRVKVPPGQQSFQCPCCCQTLTQEHAVDDDLWRKHLTNDISPYTCIAEECPKPFVFYNTTAELEYHLRQDHPQTWQCPFCEDPPIFVKKEFLEFHIRTNHMEISSEEWSGLLSMSLQYGFSIRACPLCGESDDIIDSPELISHVLEHMHSFSLLSLPWARDTSYANIEKGLRFNPSHPSLHLKLRDTKRISISTSSKPLTAIERLMPWLESDAVATMHDIADTQKSRKKIEYKSLDDSPDKSRSETEQHKPLDDSSDFFSNHLYFADQSTNASGSTQEEVTPPASSSEKYTAFYDRAEIIQVFEAFKSEFSHLLSLSTNETTIISELVAKIHSMESEIRTFNLADHDNILPTLNQMRVTICEFWAIHVNTGTDTSTYLPAIALEEIKSHLDNLQLALQQSRTQPGISNIINETENKDADNENKDNAKRENETDQEENKDTSEEKENIEGGNNAGKKNKNLEEESQIGKEKYEGFKYNMLSTLKDACVINSRDNKLFVPRQTLQKICNYHAVAEELARAIPENNPSKNKMLASLICYREAQDSSFATGRLTSSVYKGQMQDSSSGSQSCYKIFAILVLIGQAKLIETFLDHPLSDNDLPLSSNRYFDALWSPKRNPASLLQLPHGHEHSHWIEMFINRQWSVLAPYFDADNTGNTRFKVYDFHENEILPIEEVSQKKYRGGFGLVEKIKIHSEHNGFDHEYFALKTMHPMMPQESDQFFKQELNAFQMIKPGGNIIEIRAAFKKGDTRCFLFPWATGGNLNTLWAKSPLDIITSAEVQWSEFARWICIQCHGIIKDLHTIHVRSDDTNKLFGFHSDIKPENILHFTQDGSQLGSLKISDMGLMKFHRQDSRTMMSASMGNANQTYRSPEHDIGRLRSRKIDIWAFGCLFAELLTWAIRGFNGVEVFKTRRMDDDRDVSNEDEGEWVEDNFFIIKPFPLPPYYKMPKRKNSIKVWFTELINELGQNMDDTFFPEFLHFIRKHMLQPDRNRRADCIHVEAFLERLKRKPVENPYWRFNGTVMYGNGNDEGVAENGTM